MQLFSKDQESSGSLAEVQDPRLHLLRGWFCLLRGPGICIASLWGGGEHWHSQTYGHTLTSTNLTHHLPPGLLGKVSSPGYLTKMPRTSTDTFYKGKTKEKSRKCTAARSIFVYDPKFIISWEEEKNEDYGIFLRKARTFLIAYFIGIDKISFIFRKSVH